MTLSSFQALIGTAKTRPPLGVLLRQAPFQALIGTAKTGGRMITPSSRVQFQALIGTAKTDDRGRGLARCLCFKPS